MVEVYDVESGLNFVGELGRIFSKVNEVLHFALQNRQISDRRGTKYGVDRHAGHNFELNL
jgi:hypothetical protein